jgi:hypothetical protein
MTDLTYELNRLAKTLVDGRSTLSAQAAANKWAGITGAWQSANLLTENQASVETDTTGFATSGGTIAASSAHALHGSKALLTTASSTASQGLFIPAIGGVGYFPVVEGMTYTATWAAKQVSGTRSITFYLVWCTGGGDFANAGEVITVPTGSFTTYQHSGVAPTGATFARLDYTVNAGAANDQIAFDCFGLWAGEGGEWSLPGSGTGALLALLGALNVKNSTTNLGLRAVCNALGSTTNLDPAEALSNVATPA